MSGKTARTSVSPTMHHSPLLIPRKSWSSFKDSKAHQITGLVWREKIMGGSGCGQMDQYLMTRSTLMGCPHAFSSIGSGSPAQPVTPIDIGFVTSQTGKMKGDDWLEAWCNSKNNWLRGNSLLELLDIWWSCKKTSFRTTRLKMEHIYWSIKEIGIAQKQNIRFNGARISFYPDFSSAVQKRRACLTDVKKRLQKLQTPYAMLYPARLRITARGQTHFFENAADAADGWMLMKMLCVRPGDRRLKKTDLTHLDRDRIPVCIPLFSAL